MAASSRTRDVVSLLRECEEQMRPQYAEFPVVVSESSEGRDVYVVSDLHVGAGAGNDGTYAGTENFFADQAFRRFLSKAGADAGGKKALLIINGDFVDFLRICLVPETETAFASWQELLQKLGIARTTQELRSSVSDKEREFGLRTDDYKSVWKLATALAGHPQLFDGLAEWLGKGHKITILKGNHDLEWYWPAVRNALRLKLAERISGSATGPKLASALSDIVVPNVRFVGHAMLLDEHVYVEHGHRFDRFARVLGGPTLEKKQHRELNIPFGSFFNRYLINKVELDFPFFDNVRPQTDLLPLLFRERFFLGLKILFVHLPFMLLIIPKGYYEYMLKRALMFAIAVALPAILVLVQCWNIISGTFAHFTNSGQTAPLLGFLKDQGINALLGLLGAAGSFGLARLTAWLQLEEPNSLDTFAQEVFKKQPTYHIITFGHTHNADQFVKSNGTNSPSGWFYNTGTWIPVIESSSAEVREDRTYTFLRLRNERGVLRPGTLERWNDDAGRSEPLVIVRPKE